MYPVYQEEKYDVEEDFYTNEDDDRLEEARIKKIQEEEQEELREMRRLRESHLKPEKLIKKSQDSSRTTNGEERFEELTHEISECNRNLKGTQ